MTDETFESGSGPAGEGSGHRESATPRTGSAGHQESAGRGSAGREAADQGSVEPGSVEDARPGASDARAGHTLEQQLEALLLVAEDPLSAVDLATATDRPLREVRRALRALAADYDGESLGPRRGFELREMARGYRFYVRESLDPLIADFVQQRSPAKLSQAALETLAVIAYRQPISRGAIASIRAVNVDSVVRTLVGRGLIVEAGHDPETGAVLYGTDEVLLEHLGIASLDELPPIAPLLDDGSAGFDHEDRERGRQEAGPDGARTVRDGAPRRRAAAEEPDVDTEEAR